MRGFIVMAMFVVSLSYAGSREYSEVRNLELDASGLSEMFIDAGYEGDLLAAAGVSYTVGREANSRVDGRQRRRRQQ